MKVCLGEDGSGCCCCCCCRETARLLRSVAAAACCSFGAVFARGAKRPEEGASKGETFEETPSGATKAAPVTPLVAPKGGTKADGFASLAAGASAGAIVGDCRGLSTPPRAASLLFIIFISLTSSGLFCLKSGCS